uniref:Centrosomal protein CCDC61 n=1 Tax=Phallusia mammillata TaxID=59560 RepID=A0A6F9D968_9ASCI|nr:coiled-coil domain-containing protein 61 [Phallusia mammillata]
MNPDYSASSEYVFRGIEYIVTLRTIKNGSVLCVEVEDKVTAEQWRGTFESNYIEDLTHKTGNFKQFDVFVSMLESALDKSSDSVMLDLLTFSDLELLRNRKAANAGTRPRVKPNRQQENKRYLILVYSVEFDRIHYPLPLPYQGKPDPVHLQNLVRQLNDEITKLKSGRNTRVQDEEYLRLKENYECLLEDKNRLETALNEMKRETQSVGKLSASKEVKILKNVVQNLELEMMKEKNRFQRQISKKSADVKRLTSELNEITARERTLQIRVKSLTNELAMYKRSRTPNVDRPASRTRSSQNLYSATRNSATRPNTGARPGSTAARRSTSRGSRSGSFYQQNRSSSRDRPAPRRERSISQDKKSFLSRDGYKSRTPTPNRFSRFNPTLYIEEKKRKLQQSKERLNRRTSAGFIPGSNESRGRTRTRYSRGNDFSSSRERYSAGFRRRTGSIESRNSSDNGSITRIRTKRKPQAWDDSPTYPSMVSDRRLSSTPDIKRHETRQKRATKDTDMDEIDARLDALQQYMKEIERKN